MAPLTLNRDHEVVSVCPFQKPSLVVIFEDDLTFFIQGSLGDKLDGSNLGETIWAPTILARWKGPTR